MLIHRGIQMLAFLGLLVKPVKPTRATSAELLTENNVLI